MKKLIRWGLAAGLAAAVGLFFDAQAQSATGSGSSGASGSSGRGDTGGPTPGGADRSSAGQQTTPQGGAAGTSSDSGERSKSTAGGTSAGSTGSAGATGAAGREASGRQAGQQAKIDKGLQERLERIHAVNQAEIKLSQVGAQSAQSPEVKQFAEQMGTDHERADQKLTETAQSAGAASLEGKTFQKESDKAKKDLEKLQSKTGSDFDKAYMSHMVKDHEKGVKEVEKAAKDAKKANQTELASFLEQTHTGMKAHLDHAKQIEKSLTSEQRQGRRPPGATGGTGAGSERGAAGSSGSRGDTGGPTPTGKDSSSAGQPTTPQGGAAGTSSDSGQRTTK